MHALFLEVNADESAIDRAREFLPQNAVPMAQSAGAKTGFWLGPQGGRGVSFIVFDSEEEAKNAAARFKVGEPPMPGAPGGVTVRSVEVREVVASF